LQNLPPTTKHLFEAEKSNNIEAVRYLLENGADPNLNIPELTNDCPLYDLHFLWQEMLNEAHQRLAITKLFFDYGTDPDLLYDGDTLYEHLFEDLFRVPLWVTSHDPEYTKQFFLLLLAYGGGSKPILYAPPFLVEPIDRNRVFSYELKITKTEDGNQERGHIIAPNGKIIGYV